ncbi:MAG: hypothetical protein ACI89J_000642 [Hyphomicrobiaceae bacterium]|jgi:hypothetical protein
MTALNIKAGNPNLRAYMRPARANIRRQISKSQKSSFCGRDPSLSATVRTSHDPRRSQTQAFS